MLHAPDFRIPYDLKVLPSFDHAHTIIIKLTLAFLNFYEHAKKNQPISEFHDLKEHAHF